MIAIVDYGMGNVGSIQNMLYELGYDSVITSDKDILMNSDKIILPGVGSFDLGMSSLNSLGLSSVIKRYAQEEKKPVLGICLGMQMLGTSSEEGSLPGLGLIPMTFRRFKFDPGSAQKVPHMGWDMVDILHPELPIVSRMEGHQRFYFVHSYYAVVPNPDHIFMKCEYGVNFAAAVFDGNIFGVQFHPEKSHSFGMRLMENFASGVIKC